MKIYTITCHDVYNAGASLQAFALERYLQSKGHDVRILDYKPDYLSSHYSLTKVNNPLFDKPIVRSLYVLAKLPERLRKNKSRKKAEFDQFKKEYLHCSDRIYISYEELVNDPPECNALIAGSDQIWNPLFNNGKDPSFFLQFGNDEIRRISYAASFAVDGLSDDDAERMKEWLKIFDHIAVREQSGIRILKQLGYEGEVVCDPVFLLDAEEWLRLANVRPEDNHVFVCDFDQSSVIQELVNSMNDEIISYFPMSGVTCVDESGPLGFLHNLASAKLIISNSFHATAFALLFNKPFYVVERQEKINMRLYDLLNSVGLDDRIVRSAHDIETMKPIDWEKVNQHLKLIIERSKIYLNEALKENNI